MADKPAREIPEIVAAVTITTSHKLVLPDKILSYRVTPLHCIWGGAGGEVCTGLQMLDTKLREGGTLPESAVRQENKRRSDPGEASTDSTTV